jgi:hypothetical protein
VKDGIMKTPDEPAERSDLINKLVDLIMKIPPGEQYSLLKELRERVSRYKRKHYRKPVRTNVEYNAGGRSDKGLVHDISTGGVFIETRMPFRAKESISLNFSLPNAPHKKVTIHGQIARISPDGVGVEFKPLSEDQKKVIKSLLEVL